MDDKLLSSPTGPGVLEGLLPNGELDPDVEDPEDPGLDEPEVDVPELDEPVLDAPVLDEPEPGAPVLAASISVELTPTCAAAAAAAPETAPEPGIFMPLVSLPLVALSLVSLPLVVEPEPEDADGDPNGEAEEAEEPRSFAESPTLDAAAAAPEVAPEAAVAAESVADEDDVVEEVSVALEEVDGLPKSGCSSGGYQRLSDAIHQPGPCFVSLPCGCCSVISLPRSLPEARSSVRWCGSVRRSRSGSHHPKIGVSLRLFTCVRLTEASTSIRAHGRI